MSPPAVEAPATVRTGRVQLGEDMWRWTAVSEAGDGGENLDAWSVGDGCVAVVDGVTPVVSPPRVDVAAYAADVAATLVRRRRHPELWAGTISEVASRWPYSHVDVSATAAVVRGLADGMLELARLGNCGATARSGGRWTGVWRPVSGEVPATLREVAERRGSGEDHRQVWRSIQPLLEERRDGKPGRAQTVFADEPSAAGAVEAKVVEKADRIVLYTDGAGEQAVGFGLVEDISSVGEWVETFGPAEAVAQIRAAEAADPRAQAYPRVGVHTDVTILHLAVEGDR